MVKNVSRKKVLFFSLFLGLLTTLLISFSINVQAYNYSVYKGRFDTGNITYSVISGSNASYASEAVKQWNGVSSKVKIKKYTGSNAMGAKLRLNFNKIKSPNSSNLGVTYFLNNLEKLVSNKQTWYKANCIQYVNQNAKTKNQKLKTCVHEIGHALSLEHQGQFSASIMKQGVMDRYTLFPTDKANLKYKWGN